MTSDKQLILLLQAAAVLETKPLQQLAAVKLESGFHTLAMRDIHEVTDLLCDIVDDYRAIAETQPELMQETIASALRLANKLLVGLDEYEEANGPA